MMPAGTVDAHGTNHPLAFRMAAIAFVNQNLTLACMFGAFAVLMSAAGARLGVGTGLVALAIPAVMLAMAVGAPIVGVLATRGSLRRLMLGGSTLATAGFVVLALTARFPLYLAAYGLMIGPAMAVGLILPAALVTRWYVVNRGRALGIVCAPIVMIAVPPVALAMLYRFGLPATYLMLAAMSAVSIVANLFVVDRPPGGDDADASGRRGTGDDRTAIVTIPRLLATPIFWALTAASIVSSCGSVTISTYMVPIARGWNLTEPQAATLISVQSFVGVLGTIVFGWLADRIGGARALGVLVLDSAFLWALLLIGPSFWSAVLLLGLVGLHGAGAVPALTVGLSQAVGRENFTRAYGVGNFINLPFTMSCVPLAALVASRTGSYAAVLGGEALLLAVAGVVLLSCHLLVGSGSAAGAPAGVREYG